MNSSLNFFKENIIIEKTVEENNKDISENDKVESLVPEFV